MSRHREAVRHKPQSSLWHRRRNAQRPEERGNIMIIVISTAWSSVRFGPVLSSFSLWYLGSASRRSSLTSRLSRRSNRQWRGCQ